MVIKSRTSRGTLKTRLRRRFEVQRLELRTSTPKPKKPKATVIFAGLSTNKFAKGGKVTAFEFLPVFANLLRESGFDTVYVSSYRALKRAIDSCDKAIVVMIYREVGFIPDHPGLEETLAKAALVMHHPNMGRIISNKRQANKFFSDRGVPIPKLADEATASESVFSNDNNDSGASVYTLAPGSVLDHDRYNARFVDTRVKHKDETYYTSVRLMCVGPTITHMLINARPVSEGSASVHSKDTPIDSDLLLALYERLVTPNAERYTQLAQAVYRATGPGFYSHDVLLDTSNDEIFMAETGFKFNNKTYNKLMSGICGELHFLDGFQTAAKVARQSVPPFVKLVNTCLELE